MLAILAKLLAKDRADRYGSATKLAEDCDRVAHGKPPLHAELPPAKWPFAGGAPGLQVRKAGATGPVTPVDKTRASQREARPAAAAGATKWLVLLGVAAAVAVVVAFSLERNKPQPADTAAAQPPVQAERPATAPPASGVKPGKAVLSAEEMKRLFDAAEDYAKKNPMNFAGASAEFEKVRAAAKGTEFEGKARDAIAEISKRRDEAADAAAEKVAGEASALAAQGKYDSASAVWEKASAEQAGLLAPRAARATADLRSQAEAKLQGPLDEAGKCLTEKRWADGRKALDAAANVEYAAWSPRLQDLRGKLAAGEQAEAEAAKNAALAAAEGAFAQHLNTFVAATLKGENKAARKAASDAKADSSLKELAAKVQDMSDVCAALEKAEAARVAALEQLKDGKERSFETSKGTVRGVVSRLTADGIMVRVKLGGGAGEGEQPVRFTDLAPAELKPLAGDFKPETPSEHLAQGIRALGAGDVPAAKTELASAKDHPLAPAYQARLDEKLLGAVEGAAKSAWELIKRTAGTGKLSEKAAKDIGEKLAVWEQQHGKTKFAEQIAADVAALKERLLSAGGGWKALAPESIRVVLKGQAESSVDNGSLVIAVPAGPGNNAQVPLLTFARDFRLRFEFSGDMMEMALRRTPEDLRRPRPPDDQRPPPPPSGSIIVLVHANGFAVRTWPV
jgi:hypothetical protein